VFAASDSEKTQVDGFVRVFIEVRLSTKSPYDDLDASSSAQFHGPGIARRLTPVRGLPPGNSQAAEVGVGRTGE